MGRTNARRFDMPGGRLPAGVPNGVPSPFADAEDDRKRSDSPFPSLKPKPADKRAREVVEHLKERILNPGKIDGSSGMAYGDWSKEARKEITREIREAEASLAFRELMSAKRSGGLCMRIGFLLLAAVASFAAFWWGVVFIGDNYGPLWGLAATMTALGLALGFVTAGLFFGKDDEDAVRKQVLERSGLLPKDGGDAKSAHQTIR